MTIETINIGAAPRDGQGDSLRAAMEKVNSNFNYVTGELSKISDADLLGFRNPYTIYVASNGSDGDNGTSLGEAFATIEKAITTANNVIDTSPYGTRVLINVAPGEYTCSNLPYSIRHHVSIMGDGLRACFLKPAVGEERNGFFKVDSHFYMWGLTFIGHQADTEKVGWVVQLDDTADNRAIGATTLGAFISASPYFQNCSSITAEDDSGLAPSISEGDTGGGILVDGNACADNSPIRSIVLDSFTQVNLGGIGCKVINDGYAQLVSFFGTFCEYHVLCQTGGQVNFTGGTTDFGLYGLVADGYSPKPLFTALSQRDHYGVLRSDKQATIDNTTDVFTSVAHGFTNDAPVTVDINGEDVPTPLNKGTIYYVINATADTFQIAETQGGAAINITGDTTDFIYNVTTQGELFIDCVSFSESRLGSASQPYNGTLAFPVLTFPRTGSLAADNSTRGVVNTVEQDGNVFTAVAVLNTAPANVGKHEYVPGTGTVTVTRPGTFVTPDGVLLEVTPVAGLNTYTFNVTSIDYDHLTGITKFTAQDYLPSALDEFYFTGAEFICPLSAYTVTSVQAINAFGLPVAFDDPTAAGFRVNLYNPVNGGLIYPVTLGQKIDFRRRSQISAPSHVSEYVGSGMNYLALPDNGGRPQQANLYQELNNGKVFITYTNEKGDFAVTNRFLVDGTTGEVTINASQFNLSGLNFIGPFSRNGGLTTVGVQIREVSDNPNMISSLGYPDLNTVPTQTAVVGYITKLFTGESAIEALNINGIFFTAAPTPADYPATRPQLAPFELGDMIWDASKRAWLGWSGTNFSNELNVIVQKDGSVSYNFLQEAEPLFRNEGEPTQSVIQNGDRWEKPGEFIAYYNNTIPGWVNINGIDASVSGTIEASQATTVLISGSNLGGLFVEYGTNNYYLFSGPADFDYDDLLVSYDGGINWSVFSSNPWTLSNNGGTTLYRNHITGTLWTMGIGFYRSTDDGATWVGAGVNRGAMCIKSTGSLIHISGVFNTNIYSSNDDGVTWNSHGSITSQIPTIPDLSGACMVSITDDIFLLDGGPSRNALMRSVDGGFTWTLLDNTVNYRLNAGVTNGRADSTGTVYATVGGVASYSTDNGDTWVPSTVGVPTHIDYFDALLYYSKPGGANNDSVSKTPFAVSVIDTQPIRLNGRIYVSSIDITYSSATNNHGASNFVVFNFRYKDNADVAYTDVSLTLNSPYPTTTPATVSIPVNEVWEAGGIAQYMSSSVTGSPSLTSVSLSVNARRLI